MSSGRARSVTDAGPRTRRSTMVRRLASPRARNIRSSGLEDEYLGIHLSISDERVCRQPGRRRRDGLTVLAFDRCRFLHLLEACPTVSQGIASRLAEELWLTRR